MRPAAVGSRLSSTIRRAVICRHHPPGVNRRNHWGCVPRQPGNAKTSRKQTRGLAMRSSGGAAAARPGSIRLRRLVIVIAIMAILTAGWPLLNLAVSNNRSLSARSKLIVGPNQKNASVMVGRGWSMQAGQSNPRLGYSLRRGQVAVAISYVNLIDKAHTALLWDGMRQLIQISHPGATLSRPRRVTSLHRLDGEAGVVSGRNLIGTAAVYSDPPRGFAIEIIEVAPRTTARANLLAAQRIIRSVLFLSASR
jgi:hypothetical protein